MRINANHQYKMIFHEQKNGLISLHAWYRQNKALHKKSLNLTLENKTTPNAKFKDAETLRKADELLTLLDKQMERKLSGKLIERNFLEFFEMCIDNLDLVQHILNLIEEIANFDLYSLTDYRNMQVSLLEKRHRSTYLTKTNCFQHEEQK